MTAVPSEKELIGAEKDWIGGLIARMQAEPTPEAQRRFVFAHPVLLNARAIEIFARELKGNAATVQRLDDWRQYLWEHPEDYPSGLGPLDALIDGLRRRELTFAQAREQAVRLMCAGLLSNTYIKKVFDPLLKEVQQGGVFPVQAAELALDAAWAMPFPTLKVHVRLGAVRPFILVTHAALTQWPDGRLLARAHEVGNWAVTEIDWGPNLSRRADILHKLGAMDVDAYTLGRPIGPHYVAAIEAWLARATSPMPAPIDALARAIQLLSEAAPLRAPGSDRGATLKALLQAKIFEAAAQGRDPDADKLRSLATQALEHLKAAVDADARDWVLRAMEVCKST